MKTPGLVEAREHVGEPPGLDLAQGGPLGLAHVRLADEVGRIPHVPVVGCDVEVAAYRHRIPGLVRLVEHGAQPRQPLQLDGVELVVEAAAIGHIHRVHPHSAARCRNDAASVIVLRAVEPPHRIVHAQAADDRHAVPSPVAVVHRLVAQLGERLRGELVVGQLRLLQAQHVGFLRGDPLRDAGQPCPQRVDVPCRQAH